MRYRPATALALAAPLSATTLTVGGVLASLVGWRWGMGPVAASIAVLWGLALLVRGLSARPAEGDASVVWPLAGTALALVGVLAVLVPVAGSPARFPQHPDTVFHLSLTRWIMDTADASALQAAASTGLVESGFYPSAFHVVAATVALVSHAEVAVAVTGTVVVIAGIIWPLGIIVLARAILGETPAVTLAAAVASVAFSAFPFWLLGYGVLWPNLFGEALIPAMLLPVLALAAGRDLGRSLLVVLAGVPGLAVAHPNGLIAWALLAALIAALALVRQAWASRRRPGRLALVLAVLLGGSSLAVAVWALATQRADAMRAFSARGPEMPLEEALLDVFLFAPRQAGYLWGAGALVLVGLVVMVLRHRQHLWVVAGFVGVAGLYVGLASVNSYHTRLLTWPWYNNPPRLAALLVLPAALLVSAALNQAALTVARIRVRGRALGAPVGALAAVGTFVLLSGGNGTAVHEDLLDNYFDQRAPSAWVTDEELAALETLGSRLPKDAVVAANPYKGGSYLYLASGRQVLYASEKTMAPGDRALLGARLAEVGSDPSVCAAARRQRVEYALVGGDPVALQQGRHALYAGIDSVADSPAFDLVDRAGPYSLYRMTRCAGG